MRGDDSGSVGIRVPTDGSDHVCRLWGLILTLVYMTKRLSEEEEKKRDLVRGQTALLIYIEGSRLTRLRPSPLAGSN